MKLLDQVAQATLPIEIDDATGLYRFASAGAYASRLLACPIRFVASENVSRYCCTLIETDRGMLAGCNEYLRVPAPDFWLEWLGEAADDEASGTRVGVLVEAGDTGRAGLATVFWEQRQGEPVAAQMTATFDLDDDGWAGRGPADAFALTPGTHPLAPHVRFHFRSEWRAYFDRQEEGATLPVATTIITGVLPALEFLFVFSALLAERTCLTRREVELSRLNRQRSRNGRVALLDHVEVRLDLMPEAVGQRSGGAGEREAPRLHSVRGHLVNRAGQTFWRRSHLRGDPARPGPIRTVQVTRRAG